ncbi:AAA family ATPase [Phytomonospora sp. NPDC050363]|uniref:AAA family ATPase n=1 Tax=Phytomonospora sp. NPDC050363 TaxID=3155642 RepID=UPI00340C8713
MIKVLAVENYRSLRDLVVPLDAITVVTGANGSGKSSLYRALRLLSECARGGAVAALAAEGGLPSTLWAGPDHPPRDGHPVQGTVRDRPIGLRLGFAADDFGYAVDLGQPQPSQSAFSLDPEIKVEAVWAGPFLRPGTLLAERNHGRIKVRDGDGAWAVLDHRLATFDSMIAELADPRNAPELLDMRERIRGWRFYDHLRTDAAAPARETRIGTRTPVLGHDGADLAAALQTIIEIGDHEALAEAVDRAFPGSRLGVDLDGGRLGVRLRQPGLLRPLAAAELSDGTLRYLLWAAALLTPRPPELFVCNEPETSLHPELIAPLAGLIATASKDTQVIVVSHSAQLVAALEGQGAATVELRKEGGRTVVAGQGILDGPPWHWPKR